ncbi:Uncharacterized conserved protein YqhQ [Thermosyntropha lipolytica DSM 11003]|uniref:Uncharacterized conserved protein YqhQ n=1 Tax=Thermosyntropha lipolytica DSM 11003 TaxID=1123382 RepID=A0A1M5NVD7_9FIRM|nr:DUF1385 domain-containing protein [Thermosyntropha lipolytica]SHG93501.1 Uncharacterized conserved protein YqhQ [Thermosyntropha lipolytica DSM 11003]
MKKDVKYGGMAVIEGVMMRSEHEVAIAVRRPDGLIELEKEKLKELPRGLFWLKWPFIRGTYMLVDAMVLGVKMLNKSANMSMEEEEEALSSLEIFWTTFTAFILAILLFIVLPAGLVHFLSPFIGGVWKQNIVEGVIRIIFFLLYVYFISKIDDIKRVFMYHGAEHKSIAAWEAGEELTVENARKYSTLHPRCGTSFLLLVMVVSILVFALLGEGNLFYRVGTRLAVLPVVAGLSYEFMRFSARYYEKRWARFLIVPGLWLQKLTTREPDDEQLEVALTALKAVIPEYNNKVLAAE